MPSFWLPSSGRQSRATASSDGPLTIYILTTAPKWPRNSPPPILGPFLFEFCADQSGGGLGAGPDVGREKGRGGVPETEIVTVCNQKTEPIPGLWHSVLKVTKILRIGK